MRLPHVFLRHTYTKYNVYYFYGCRWCDDVNSVVTVSWVCTLYVWIGLCVRVWRARRNMPLASAFVSWIYWNGVSERVYGKTLERLELCRKLFTSQRGADVILSWNDDNDAYVYHTQRQHFTIRLPSANTFSFHSRARLLQWTSLHCDLFQYRRHTKVNINF